MSGLDGLRLDADGYLDMDQFPDDGTDLAGPELDQLRETLHADPVEEPTPEQWDAMFDDVVTVDGTGPFALDDVDGLTTDDGFDAGGDGLPDVDDGLPDDLPVDDADDLDLDPTDYDGGLDLTPDDVVDDAYTPEALDDAPAEVANNDFEDLL
ncbi:MAG TPA: hypothetical protein VF228_20365 [Iamia sp.]